jgi:radical SAM superfamily enzyme YgiQ (UPF0313 family)
MRVCMIEACNDADRGSIGASYVVEHARRAGYSVDILRAPKAGYDVELISVHHCTDFERLACMPKLAKWRIVGGHPMANNPRPVIPFADAICVGEGESWIKRALPLLDETDDVRSLTRLPGTIVSPVWRIGDSVPTPNVEDPLPNNPPYLNYPGTRSAAWYIEIARGCPYWCRFCELGNSMPYRHYSTEHLQGVLEQTDATLARKINFFAPDEAAHPKYHELHDMLTRRGYSAGFSSMRVDSILRHGLPKGVKRNLLVRMGIDGLTEETRRRAGKPITDDMIVECFQYLLRRGHSQFKMFMIHGYPWEKPDDFYGFEQLMGRVFALQLTKNVSLRVKWTPFIPQPCTPLGDTQSKYDFQTIDRINTWHMLHARPKNEPGWFIENDGMMSYYTHKRQCELTSGDERTLLQLPGAQPLYRF